MDKGRKSFWRIDPVKIPSWPAGVAHGRVGWNLMSQFSWVAGESTY